MKKIILLFISCFLMFGLTSCDSTQTPDVIEQITLNNHIEEISSAYEKGEKSCVTIYNELNKKTDSSVGVIYKKEDNKYYCLTYLFFDVKYTNNFFYVKKSADEASRMKAILVGCDETNYLCIFTFESNDEFQVASYDETFDMKVGETILAIASSSSDEFYNVLAHGIVSRIGNSSFQHDSSFGMIFPGSALFDLEGKLVGFTNEQINKVESLDGIINVEGLSFTFKIEGLLKVINDIEQIKTSFSRRKLGVEVAEIHDSSDSEVIFPEEMHSIISVSKIDPTSIFRNSLLKNDIIYEINGFKIETLVDIKEALKLISPNESITLKVFRGTDLGYQKLTFVK